MLRLGRVVALLFLVGVSDAFRPASQILARQVQRPAIATDEDLIVESRAVVDRDEDRGSFWRSAKLALDKVALEEALEYFAARGVDVNEKPVLAARDVVDAPTRKPAFEYPMPPLRVVRSCGVRLRVLGFYTYCEVRFRWGTTYYHFKGHAPGRFLLGGTAVSASGFIYFDGESALGSGDTVEFGVYRRRLSHDDDDDDDDDEQLYVVWNGAAAKCSVDSAVGRRILSFGGYGNWTKFA